MAIDGQLFALEQGVVDDERRRAAFSGSVQGEDFQGIRARYGIRLLYRLRPAANRHIINEQTERDGINKYLLRVAQQSIMKHDHIFSAQWTAKIF